MSPLVTNSRTGVVRLESPNLSVIYESAAPVRALLMSPVEPENGVKSEHRFASSAEVFLIRHFN
jgi:hypothetical protein